MDRVASVIGPTKSEIETERESEGLGRFTKHFELHLEWVALCLLLDISSQGPRC